jgi:transposase
MRGEDRTSGALFSYVDIEARIPAQHPLRAMRRVTNAALAELDRAFSALYEAIGRPSIPPERLLRATLLQLLYSIRSERQLVERIEFDMLFRWFVGLSIDERVFDASTFSKNRDRLLTHEIAQRVSVFAPRPGGGEGASERRAFFGRWNDVESLGVDEELPSEEFLGRRPGDRLGRSASAGAQPRGRLS